MSVEFYRESPGKFDSRTLNWKTLNRWTGRNIMTVVHHHDNGKLVIMIIMMIMILTGSDGRSK